jgi:hypothetical protein
MPNEQQASAAPAPYPLAMVVCDGFWRHPHTGKHTLIGTFSTLFGRSFPLVHPAMAVYVLLTEGRGRTRIRFELVDADEQYPPVFQAEGEINFPNPRAVCELCLPVQGATFPRPGEYRLKLFAGGQFVIERRILVLGHPEPGELA